MRILVAEDDTALASFVKKDLEAEHYAVDVSADGEQARAMAGELCVSCAPMIGRTVVTRIKDRRAQARRALIGPKGNQTNRGQNNNDQVDDDQMDRSA
jgi:DNA-binding response OmpR family regulator